MFSSKGVKSEFSSLGKSLKIFGANLVNIFCINFVLKGIIPFGITNLVNKIKIYTNLIKLFHFEIYSVLFLFKNPSKYIILFVNATWINIG